MSRRQKEWAALARKTLLSSLGEKCANCGSTKDLTFDCIRPKGHRHHTLEPSARMSFYRAEASQGNLQVLCRPCNASKDRPRIGRPGVAWRYGYRP